MLAQTQSYPVVALASSASRALALPASCDTAAANALSVVRLARSDKERLLGRSL